MQNDRLVLITSSFVIGIFLLFPNMVLADGTGVIEPPVTREAGMPQTDADQANFAPFSEPEAAGYIDGTIASNHMQSELGARVKQELKANGNGQLDNVEVTVKKEGTVALQGIVTNEAQKEAAQEVASQTDGVNEVHNRLIVQN